MNDAIYEVLYNGILRIMMHKGIQKRKERLKDIQKALKKDIEKKTHLIELIKGYLEAPKPSYQT